MKPIVGTKVPLLSQPVATLPLAAQKSAYPRRTSQAQMQTSVPALFAEGVDVGVELALHWIEAELARYGTASGSVQTVLSQIRALSRQARRGSFHRQVLRGRAIPKERARSAVASP